MPSVLVFEGWDASGKGPSILKLTERLEPRGFEVHYLTDRPRTYELDLPWMWRFWRRLLPPVEKQILIFDRSWYGRVLVERVEGFAREDEWKRAYREINDFERQLVEGGTVVVKLWFHISRDEQHRRFEDRRSTPYKRWKLTDEDWRNRDKWDAYAAAVNEMLVKTSTLKAPWTLVEAEDKRYARVKVVRTLAELLAKELG